MGADAAILAAQQHLIPTAYELFDRIAAGQIVTGDNRYPLEVWRLMYLTFRHALITVAGRGNDWRSAATRLEELIHRFPGFPAGGWWNGGGFHMTGNAPTQHFRRAFDRTYRRYLNQAGYCEGLAWRPSTPSTLINPDHVPSAIACRPTARPRKPVQLFRGADYRGRYGMSWTAMPWGAYGAAIDRQRTDATVTAVYMIDAPPEALLARMYSYGTTAGTPNERVVWDEYVVDPAYLNVRTVRLLAQIQSDGALTSNGGVDALQARFADNMRIGG